MTDFTTIHLPEGHEDHSENHTENTPSTEHVVSSERQEEHSDNSEYKLHEIDSEDVYRSLAEEGELKLCDDPMIAVGINNAHRSATVPDGPGSDLWTADQCYAASQRVYQFKAPTVVPPLWGCALGVNQQNYTTKFAKEFPEASLTLPMPNVVICGGAAAWPLSDSKKKPGDVDFFLYGLPADESEQSRVARWKCVTSLLQKIRDQFSICTETLMEGLITIQCCPKTNRPYWSHLPTIKFQIILRAYESVSAILHAFDVPSCCVAYDGHRTYMTYLAAYAHVFHANIVVPEYRSTTYESRLMKYFERGYALVMPHLDTTKLKVGTKVVLPNLAIQIATIKYNLITGKLGLLQDQPKSDYEYLTIENTRALVRTWSVEGVRFANLKRVANQQSLLKFGMYSDRPLRPHFRRNAYSNSEGLDLAESTKTDIINRASFEVLVRYAAKHVVSRQKHRVNTVMLRTVFGLTNDQVAQLTRAVDTQAAHEKVVIDVSPSLEKAIQTLLAKYDAIPDKIEWWILVDPTRQHTASLNPRCEHPAEWYGEYFTEPVAPSLEESYSVLIHMFEQRRAGRAEAAPFDGDCGICSDAVQSGDANSVTLACRHVFHWGESQNCGGLFTWIQAGNNNCPICRGHFGGEEVRFPVTPIVEVRIEL